jgi:hypothetical protein
MGRAISTTIAFLLLAGCQPGPEPGAPPGEPVASYACSSGVLVDLDQPTLDRMADALGETGLGATVCETFAPDEPPSGEETVSATLPDGTPVTATIRSPAAPA